jgi:hypothetical protein
MRLGGAGLLRGAVTDRGAAGDKRRPVCPLCLGDRGSDRFGIVAVDAHRTPARRLEPLRLVDRVRQRERAVDRDAVIVEQHD